MIADRSTITTHTRRGSIFAAACAALALLAPPALAAGPGGGGGGDTTGSVYADLVIALRAENGTPILEKYVVPETAESTASTEYCVQPVSYEAIPGVAASRANPVDGRTVWVVPLQGALVTETTVPPGFTGACDPQPQYAMFVKEVDLERLNLARTADSVIAQKLWDVQLKLAFADEIILGPTGRITYDGTAIDASPENAAMYQSLMKFGTIPGLPDDQAGPPATIGPAPVGDANSQFDAWELAAMTLGAAASKSTPLTLDAVEYYNRVIGFPPPADPTATPPVPEYESPWGVNFVRSADPDDPTTELAGTERFVDYSGFTYNRSQTFKGSVTWLDVPTLTWKVSKITDVVPFTNLSSYDEIADHTLTGVTAFAQLADDVRALCNYVPDNTFIPGFYMDVPGIDTTADQLKAIHDPAVDLVDLPTIVFKTYPFQVTASLLNPWGGTLVDEAQLRLKVDAPDALAVGDVTASSAADGQSVPWTADANGDLVGAWGPDTGFPVAPGYNVSTTFDVTLADAAPIGDYVLTLELIDIDDPAAILAAETGTLRVNANVATVLWGEPLPKYTTQGVATTVPVTVYAPQPGTAELTLTVSGPGDDPATPASEATEAGDVAVYGSDGTDMVPMPLTLNGEGELVGTWSAAVVNGYTPVTWYATVAVGAPTGNYTVGADLPGGNSLDSLVVAVFAPETHGEKPPGAGEDTTAPVVTLEPVGVPAASATFTFSADEDGVTFECMLTWNAADGPWESCTSPKSYTDLQPGSYLFSVRGTDRVGLVSAVSTYEWTVEPPPDTTPPVVTINQTAEGVKPTFEFTADEPDVMFECQLMQNRRVVEAWATCESPKTYTGLKPVTYVFSVRGTDAAGNTSTPVTATFTVSKANAVRK